MVKHACYICIVSHMHLSTILHGVLLEYFDPYIIIAHLTCVFVASILHQGWYLSCQPGSWLLNGKSND